MQKGTCESLITCNLKQWSQSSYVNTILCESNNTINLIESVIYQSNEVQFHWTISHCACKYESLETSQHTYQTLVNLTSHASFEKLCTRQFITIAWIHSMHISIEFELIVANSASSNQLHQLIMYQSHILQVIWTNLHIQCEWLESFNTFINANVNQSSHSMWNIKIKHNWIFKIDSQYAFDNIYQVKLVDNIRKSIYCNCKLHNMHMSIESMVGWTNMQVSFEWIHQIHNIKLLISIECINA